MVSQSINYVNFMELLGYSPYFMSDVHCLTSIDGECNAVLGCALSIECGDSYSPLTE